VVKANLGDAHAMGQKPITFLRQVLALVACPTLIDTCQFNEDVKIRAKSILSQCRGESAGM
jgi:alanine transaminase